MAKVTRLRRCAFIEESGEIRYVGVFVDGFYMVHEVDTMWSGYIRADQMQRFIEGRNGDLLELVFMDGEDCEWRPKEEESRKMIIGGKEVDRIEVFHGAEKVAVITDDKKTGAPGYRIEFKAGKTTTVKKCSDMDDAEFAEAAGMAQCYKGICEEDALEKKKQELASLKAELKQKIEEARAKAKADAEKAKEKETQDAVEVAKREAYVEAELKQKIAEARAKAKADAEKEKRRLVAELAEAKAESRRLEKTADPQVAAFKVRADALQESFNKCLGCIDEEPDEERQKTMKAALKKLVGIMDGKLE